MPWELRDGEPVIDAALVRALLAEQHPDLSDLLVGDTVRGWDNTMVRLGGSLALRLPQTLPPALAPRGSTSQQHRAGGRRAGRGVGLWASGARGLR